MKLTQGTGRGTCRWNKNIPFFNRVFDTLNILWDVVLLILSGGLTYSDILFIAMGVHSVFYIISTLTFDIASFIQSFNERHRKATLSKAEQNDLDAVLNRYGMLLINIIIVIFI